MSEYYRLIDVDKDNKELRKQLDYYKRKSARLQQENEQLKDNWNKLKEYIVENNKVLYWVNNYDDILNEIQKLEGSDSNE